MSIIKTYSEILYEKMDNNIEIAKRNFIKSVLPIYGSSVNGNPIHIGTSILIQINANKIFITAAHIIDKLKLTQLYVGVNFKLVPIEGNFKVSPKVKDSREKDHFDFAYIVLKDDLHSSFKGIPAIDENMISKYDGNTKGHHYVAFGYPNSKNKKIDFVNNTVQPKIMKYSSVVKKSKPLCDHLGISGNNHLFLDFDSKYSKNSKGQKIPSIEPKGISGGALIDMGNINKRILNNDLEYSCELVAMLIENHKNYKLFSAVKINLIINTINKYIAP